MNFVHIEDFIHPDAGYQLNLLSKLQVQQGHTVTIVTSELAKIPDYLTVFFGKENIKEKDKKFFERTGVKIIRVPILFFYSGRSIYYPSIFSFVDSLKPDVLFVHGEDTMIGMQYIWRSSKMKYPLVLDCHMLEMASMNKFRTLFRFFYKTFITPKIIRNNIPLIRVVDSNYVEKCLGLPLSKTILLSFGTDTELFKPISLVSKSFREKYGIGIDDFVILYAGKLDIYKGGYFFAESIKEKLLIPSGRNIVFVIIGNTNGTYGQNVELCFSESKNKIIRFPTQTYSDLAYFFQAADLSIFPKQCSMSFYEVQSCGVPVLLEENEINNERAQYGNGFTFKPSDINDFRAKMIYCAEMDKAAYEKIKLNSRRFILDNYDYLPIAQKFTDVMVKEYNRFQDSKNYNLYFTGSKLYGDDFNIDEINQWHEEETEAYADLGSKDIKNYNYEYHSLNELIGFKNLPKEIKFNNVLGIGSAYGDEFLPIIDRIFKLTILEPSKSLKSERIGNITPEYSTPSIDGSIGYEDNNFDLITCFGVLHHIPNVSFVLDELIRVLAPNGFLLIKEPISTMGDWRKPRLGVTKNERGIPVRLFDEIFGNNNVEIVAKTYIDSLFVYKILSKIFKIDMTTKKYVLIDKFISLLFSWNIHYHRTSKYQKIAPGAVFYVIRKLPK
jgi:SAM-dependent methyltransferase